eukprot:5334236-Pleurochrysis_carterae.AAC.2
MKLSLRLAQAVSVAVGAGPPSLFVWLDSRPLCPSLYPTHTDTLYHLQGSQGGFRFFPYFTSFRISAERESCTVHDFRFSALRIPRNHFNEDSHTTFDNTQPARVKLPAFSASTHGLVQRHSRPCSFVIGKLTHTLQCACPNR